MDRMTEALMMKLAGHSYQEIAAALHISKQRAFQLVDAARKSGRYNARIEVGAADGVDAEELAAALREHAASLGIKAPGAES